MGKPCGAGKESRRPDYMCAFALPGPFVYCPSHNACGCSRPAPVFRTHRSGEPKVDPHHLRCQARTFLVRRHAFLSRTSAPDRPVIRPCGVQVSTCHIPFPVRPTIDSWVSRAPPTGRRRRATGQTRLRSGSRWHTSRNQRGAAARSVVVSSDNASRIV